MQKRLRLALATAAATALTGGLLTVAAGPATAAGSGAYADFNNDGISDVAFSAGDATVNGRAGAGAIVALYGSANGLTASHRRTLTQDSTGVPGTAEAGDAFGWGSAVGDFDGDGFDDLAVSADHEEVDGDVNGGLVEIIWGSSTGLSGGTVVADPAPSAHDRWGKSLAAGDFDGDGTTDLAIGASDSTVRVYKGGISRSGTAKGRYSVTPPIQSLHDTGPLNLTAGDTNGDGRTDLVVDGFETDSDAGWNANYLVKGTASGLDAATSKKLLPGIITAIGDVNGDHFGDIIVGCQWDGTSGVPGSVKGGKVSVVYGSSDGDAGAAQTITQDSGALPGGSESGDSFGAELTLGDINGDGYQDLAVGAYGEDLTANGKSYKNAGSTYVVYGSPTGLNTKSGVQYLTQDTSGVPDFIEADDRFGSEVKLADVTGDGKADLTIGSLGENGGNGQVTALRSNGTKITTTGAVTFYDSSVGVSTAGSPYFGANAAN
jgi:hypothetical protein